MNAMDYSAIQAMRDAEINLERGYQAALERFDRYQDAVEHAAVIEREILLGKTLGDLLNHLGGPLGSRLDELVDEIAQDFARAKLEVVE